MPIFHTTKQKLKLFLESDDWQAEMRKLELEPSAKLATIKEIVAPLSIFLPKGGEVHWRAASTLGLAVARLAEHDRETARDVMRRLMWKMNEDSGNIGWGVPEGMAEILARSETLSREYAKILISYIIDTGKADNYIDHAPLRRSAYWAAGRLAAARPDWIPAAFPHLLAGLADEDQAGRGVAAWAVGGLAPHLSEEEKNLALAALEDLAAQQPAALCEIFENSRMRLVPAAELAEEALAKLRKA